MAENLSTLTPITHHAAKGWYMTREPEEGKDEYFHSDGKWRPTTVNEKDEFTGYFPSNRTMWDTYHKHNPAS